jgi:hypothetical protein
MAGFAYAPTAATLRVGDSGDIAGGATWRWVARGRGRYAIRCLYHPNMTATATVR